MMLCLSMLMVNRIIRGIRMRLVEDGDEAGFGFVTQRRPEKAMHSKTKVSVSHSRLVLRP